MLADSNAATSLLNPWFSLLQDVCVYAILTSQQSVLQTHFNDRKFINLTIIWTGLLMKLFNSMTNSFKISAQNSHTIRNNFLLKSYNRSWWVQCGSVERGSDVGLQDYPPLEGTYAHHNSLPYPQAFLALHIYQCKLSWPDHALGSEGTTTSM